MKIEDLADLQNVIKCSKDKKYAKELRAQRKEYLEEAAYLDSQIEEMRRKVNELKQRAVKNSRIIAQSNHLMIINETPISVIKQAKSIKISLAGTNLDRSWQSDLSIWLNSKNHEAYSLSITGKGFYPGQTQKFISIDKLIQVGANYVAKMISEEELAQQIYEAL